LVTTIAITAAADGTENGAHDRNRALTHTSLLRQQPIFLGVQFGRPAPYPSIAGLIA
jgi:hypothetical protein